MSLKGVDEPGGDIAKTSDITLNHLMLSKISCPKPPFPGLAVGTAGWCLVVKNDPSLCTANQAALLMAGKIPLLPREHAYCLKYQNR